MKSFNSFIMMTIIYIFIIALGALLQILEIVLALGGVFYIITMIYLYYSSKDEYQKYFEERRNFKILVSYLKQQIF